MRTYDLVLFGATGFTGRRAAARLAERVPDTLRWAVAGRDAARLDALVRELPRAVDTIVADATDPGAMRALAADTRVVATTAGPFSRYADHLVAACVDEKTHYTDITGETPWVRTVIDRFHDRAAADGTRIVPFCGFDSIPSDLGAYSLVEYLRRVHGEGTVEVRAAFRLSGGLNGGTLASALELSEQGASLGDPGLLNPPERRDPGYRDDLSVRRHPELGVIGPFIMGPVNTRVVRRSAALFELEGHPYGPGFRYQEHMSHRSVVGAWGVTAALGVFDQALRRKAGRALLRRLGPAPGQGPSEETIAGGRTEVRYVAVGESGRRVHGRVSYPGDPGNAATVAMLCEAALSLAVDDLPERAGVLTPATAFEGRLVERLRDAGFTWEIGGGGEG